MFVLLTSDAHEIAQFFYKLFVILLKVQYSFKMYNGTEEALAFTQNFELSSRSDPKLSNGQWYKPQSIKDDLH